MDYNKFVLKSTLVYIKNGFDADDAISKSVRLADKMVQKGYLVDPNIDDSD